MKAPTWDTFAREAVQLFEASPDKVSQRADVARLEIYTTDLIVVLGALYHPLESRERPPGPEGHGRQACARVSSLWHAFWFADYISIQCLTYHSRSSVILNRFEVLTSSLISHMQARSAVPAAPSESDVTKPPGIGTTKAAESANVQSAIAGSAGKKKASKKKKK